MTYLLATLVSLFAGATFGSFVTYKVVTAHVEQVFSRFLAEVSEEAEAADDAFAFRDL